MTMTFDTYDLVFEGGGAKGSVFVGALEEFSAAGLKTRRLIGTSAGAITATLLAAGYTPQEMLAAVNEKLDNGKPRFSAFMDPPERADFSEDEINGSVTMEVFKKIPIPDLFHVDERLLHTFMDDRQYRQLF